jgi:predicted metal-dependent HD superfamily phosphohydrolase
MRFTLEEQKAVLARSGVLAIVTSDQIGKLLNRYSEPHRHYHVWDHALQVLSWVNYLAEVADLRQTLTAEWISDMELAALFHDVVYDALKGAPFNESASVEVMRSFGIQRPRAEDIILATARHGKTLPDDLPKPHALFLDCDIAHFGEKRYEIVRWNDDNVTREFEVHYSKEQVAEGRKKFLAGMIADGRRLYMSQHFYDMFERQAQLNLQRLIREP